MALGAMKQDRSLEEMLQSTSDVLFPEDMGERIVTLNCKDVCGDTPLHVMTWRSDRVAVRTFIDAGAEIDAIGDMGQTPLHVAVMREDEFLVELFLKAGANPNVRSEFGDTSLELAQKKGRDMTRLFKYAAQQAVAADRPKKGSG
jgi:ankyrin repeat protein